MQISSPFRFGLMSTLIRLVRRPTTSLSNYLARQEFLASQRYMKKKGLWKD